jgi:hypothetical protein
MDQQRSYLKGVPLKRSATDGCHRICVLSNTSTIPALPHSLGTGGEPIRSCTAVRITCFGPIKFLGLRFPHWPGDRIGECCRRSRPPMSSARHEYCLAGWQPEPRAEIPLSSRENCAHSEADRLCAPLRPRWHLPLSNSFASCRTYLDLVCAGNQIREALNSHFVGQPSPGATFVAV